MWRSLLALLALLAAGPSAAQNTLPFPNLPPNSVVGRIGGGSGPAEAIPFATLSGQITASCVTATTSVLGCVKPDGSTVTITGGGVITAVAGAATAVTVGSTTIGSGTNGSLLWDNAGTLANSTLSALTDTGFGSAQGDIAFRGASTWGVLAPGTSGFVLQTQGAAANPVWGQLAASNLSNGVVGSGAVVLSAGPTLTGTISGSFTLATALPIGSGGTSQQTAPLARSSAGLNIDQLTSKGDQNYTIASTDRFVGTSAAFTASRTWTLPAANTFTPGQALHVLDIAGGITGSNTLVIARAGADTINGGASVTINTANAGYLLVSDGVSKWSAQALGAQATAGVSSLNGLTGALSVAGNGNAISAASSTVTVNRIVGRPEGRLTLVTGTPVMTSSQTAKSQVFYDCYNGNGVSVYNGTIDVTLTIGACEISTTMQTSSTGVTNNAGVFDVWAVNVSGTLTICVATNGSGGGWASDTGGSNTARGTGYSQLDIATRPYVTNKNAIAHCYNGATDEGSVSANQATYIGTLTTTAAGQTGVTFATSGASGSAGTIGLYNAYNKVLIRSTEQDTTASWTLGTVAWRSSHGSTANRINYVDGLADVSVRAVFQAQGQGVANTTDIYVGTNRDSTSATPVVVTEGRANNSKPSMNNINDFVPSIGLHFIQAMENVDSTTTATFYGTDPDSGSSYQVHQLSVEVMM
jgi:hypothetical protein